jgi:uncharacterized sulfatase
MNRLAKVAGGVLAVLVLLGSLAWVYRIDILLALIERNRQFDAPPNQSITWDRGPDPQGRPAEDRPPNIVLILADDLGFNDPTFGGGGVAGGSVPTPSIDSIARDGVTFTQGYSANGTCAPSRAALMTGRYGTRFGFEFTPTPAGMGSTIRRITGSLEGRIRTGKDGDPDAESVGFNRMGVPASEITLAELLAPAGYHSVHIGKWHLGGGNGMSAHEQGFDESLLMASGLYLPEDHPDVVNSKQSFDPIDQFLWRVLNYAAAFNGSEVFEPGGYLTDYYTDEAVKVIEANKDRPFFLYLAHWAPHTPLQATRADYDALSHIEDHRLRVYAAMIRALDRGVGRVLDALRENGLEDNTLVFFTSDNGAPNYIGLPEVNEPLRGWKITFFEGGIHVPYLVKWPQKLAAGQSFDNPVHGFDFFATAAAAAGVALPGDRQIDGVDLVPFLLDDTLGPPHERLFWRSGHYQVVLDDGWKLQVNQESPSSPWLFDLENDPTESTNLAQREPERVAALQRMLDEHNADQAESLWPSGGQMPVSIDKTLVDDEAEDDTYIYWPN